MSKKVSVEARVDVHEPGRFVESVIGHDETKDVTIDSLDSADLVIEDKFGFERKTPSDFANSMMGKDERLDDQIERMKQDYEGSFVLIEGNIEDFDSLIHTNVKSQSLRGYAASIEVREGVPVKFCGSAELLVDMAVRLSRKMIEDPTSSLRVKSSVRDTEPVAKQIIGCVDLVGPEMADTLYEKYGSIPALTTAIENDDIEEIDGLGPATADNLRSQFT